MTGAKIQGADKLLRKLVRLQHPTRPLRAATRAGVAVLGKAVRREVPRRSGLTKKAETTKVSVKGLRAWAAAGADVGKLKTQASDSKGRRPSNIDWLIEYGHVAPDGTFIPPNGFMRRAAGTMPQAERVFVDRLASEIEKQATQG